MAASGTVVELRVHGVSGTPPEALLGCPTEFLDEVAGDKSAGFYRRQPWVDDAMSRGRPRAWRKVLEAYSWGGLTSGSGEPCVVAAVSAVHLHQPGALDAAARHQAAPGRRSLGRACCD